MSQYILGIVSDPGRPEGRSTIPDTLKNYHCDRICRGALYHIEIDNTAGAQQGVVSMTVNGEKINGTLVPSQDRRRNMKSGL